MISSSITPNLSNQFSLPKSRKNDLLVIIYPVFSYSIVFNIVSLNLAWSSVNLIFEDSPIVYSDTLTLIKSTLLRCYNTSTLLISELSKKYIIDWKILKIKHFLDLDCLRRKLKVSPQPFSIYRWSASIPSALHLKKQ